MSGVFSTHFTKETGMLKFKWKHAFILLAFAWGIAFGQAPPAISRDMLPDYVAKNYVKKDALSFVIFGDWGRNGYFHQREVGDEMGLVAEAMGADFIISAGDNFQVNGVRSISDPLWQTNFENIYTHPSLLKDWYPVLGNHDYLGNPQAEIDYSKISRRWNMISRYYTVHKKVADSCNVDFYFLDTSPFQKLYRKDKRFSDLDQQDTLAQLHWLDSALTASKSRWKIVVGHHPVYSGGEHASDLVDMPPRFADRFSRSGVDAYFSGHDHHFEHIRQKGGSVNYFIVGTGSSVRPVTSTPATLFSKSISGFTAVYISKDTLTVRAIDYKGNIFYSAAITKTPN